MRIELHSRKLVETDFQDKALNNYTSYDKILLAGDFSVEKSRFCLDLFLCKYDFASVVEDDTCFKSLIKLSCVDLILTMFKHSLTFLYGGERWLLMG